MINECLHVNNYFANTNLARQGETNYIAELTIPSCIDHHHHLTISLPKINKHKFTSKSDRPVLTAPVF